MIHWTRNNPVFFERDRSFNPSWVFIGALVIIQCCATVWAFQQDSITVKVVSLGLLGVTVNIFVMAAVSQNKAKIIAHATSTGAIASGLVHCEPAKDPMTAITDHEDRP